MRLFDSRLRLRHLHCLIALAHHRSVNRAAEALSQTPSAVSKSLTELEAIVGESLILRYRKGLELTPSGQTLLRFAAQAMGSLREGLDQLGDGKQAPQYLRIGVLPTATNVVVPAIQQVQAHYPAIVITTHTSTNIDLLLRLKLGELDVMLGRIAHPSEMTGIAYEHLYSEPMLLVVRPGHPLLAHSTTVAGDLAAYAMILPSKGTTIRAAADVYLHEMGATIPPRITETVSSSLARCLMQDSDTIWFAAHGAVAAELAAGSAVALALDTRSTAASVGLSTIAAGALSDAALLFIATIRSAAARLAHG